ncbi:methionine-R-sulfoxide reductase [Malonomonas rubra DSM 5091]|uniref:Peptide methionine sulfoxide reductase MsrB n=1 Tax=Malonomonas rubra DSM 5091 TaxID=1122189 RepID=A0A1M6I7I9_MALRU|nr:peptide-methionine (R)-S-oxide reductase MsrB [Malonomonas rubra]SHJ30409.1 methionine-R-sulfoxide reductase [Malonomonas rubra DSM 5091]
MKRSTKKMPIFYCFMTLFLGSQLAFAADMMDQGMKKNTSGHAMGTEMQDSMDVKAMDKGMKKSMQDNMLDTQDRMKEKPMMHDGKMKMDDGMSMKREYSVPSDEELRKSLTPLQYKVTRKEGTEPAFNNTYWDNHDAGLYVDVISGVPLFSSTDKYDSGTGWPSFTKPLDPDAVFVTEDRSFFMVRNEVRSKLADAHLGHVFDDGPQPTGLRYCMNSAALRFIPADELEKEGYGDYVHLFK